MENIEEVKKVTPKKTTTKKATTKTKIDPKTGTLKVVEKKTATKATTKKATTKKTTTKKATTKKTTKKAETTPKQPVIIKKSPAKIIKVSEPTVNIADDVIENKTDSLDTTLGIEIKKRGRKPSENPLPKVSSKSLTIEPPKREPKEETKKEKEKNTEPTVIVRPTPKKVKVWTKEEKPLYKKLSEAFTYIANLTNVIEEKTMDTKLIQDLTIGELHVIEMVDQNNNKPMSLIAKKLKVTVGSLTISINRLVQKGYLLRIRHEMDHRIILVSTTQKAKKVLKEHDKFHENILGLVLDTITLKQAVTVMNQFALVLENYYDPKSITTTVKKGSTK